MVLKKGEIVDLCKINFFCSIISRIIKYFLNNYQFLETLTANISFYLATAL